MIMCGRSKLNATAPQIYSCALPRGAGGGGGTGGYGTMCGPGYPAIGWYITCGGGGGGGGGPPPADGVDSEFGEEEELARGESPLAGGGGGPGGPAGKP